MSLRTTPPIRGRFPPQLAHYERLRAPTQSPRVGDSSVSMVFCTRWVGKLCTSSAPAGEPAAPGRSAPPRSAKESARGGTLMSLPEGAALGHNFSSPVRRSQQKVEKATAPPPFPVRYAGIAHPSPALTEPGPSVSPTRWRGGVLRRDFRGAERCERIFRMRPQGARSEARAGPLRRRGGNIRSNASKTNTSQLRSTAPLTKTKKLNTKPLSRKAKGFSFVRDTGIEPVTSSVSGKRATAAPIALTKQLFCCEVRTGFEPAYTALQAAA